MDLFEIPSALRPLIKASWKNRESDFLGRFDFIWDGTGSPKLLEYNADTPTILVETGVGQQEWFKRCKIEENNKSAWSFNDVDEAVKRKWRKLAKTSPVVYFLAPDIDRSRDVEEHEHKEYLKATATACGIKVKEINNAQLLSMLEHDPPISTEVPLVVWKISPYEWMAYDPSSSQLFNSDRSTQVHWLEPPWKLILGNKAILPLLWEMYPNHPNLLFSTFAEADAIHSILIDSKRLVGKPKYGREGQGVVYSGSDSASGFVKKANSASSVSVTDADRTENIFLGDPIFQEYHSTSRFSGRKIVLGSWMSAGQPSGICIREDSQETTVDNSSFVPHYVVGEQLTSASLPQLNASQMALRKGLYGDDSVSRGATNSYNSGGSSYVRNWFRSYGSDSSTDGVTSSAHHPAGSSSVSSDGHATTTGGVVVPINNSAGGAAPHGNTSTQAGASMRERVLEKMRSVRQKHFSGSMSDRASKYKHSVRARHSARAASGRSSSGGGGKGGG